MATTSYGSITIVDITDIGEFSVYPKIQGSKNQIYNVDTGTVTPDWDNTGGNTGTPIIIDPVAYYGGNNVSSTSGITYTWTRRDGAGAETALLAGETVQTDATQAHYGRLTINKNMLTLNNSSGLITYILTASYSVDDIPLSAVGEADFALIKQGSNAKNARITGRNIFKYNTEGALTPSNDTIILTGEVTNTSINSWYYKNSSGNFVTTGAGSGTTIRINPTNNTISYGTNYGSTTPTISDLFNNDVATFKLVTSDNNTYDIFSITKLRDGAAGSSVATAVLTNDDQMIPFDYTGATGDFTSAISQVKIYVGGVQQTSGWTISQDLDSVSATASTTDITNDTVTVTAFSGTATTGNVTFTCTGTVEGASITLTKTFSLIKVKSGQNGVSPTIYSIEPDVYALNKSSESSPSFTPSSVTFSAYEQTGTTKSPYSGRIQFFNSNGDLMNNVGSTSGTPEDTTNRISRTFTPPASWTDTITAKLYATNAAISGNTPLDTQTVIITFDGAKGQDGEQGETGPGALQVVLTNEAEVIPCNSNNNPIANGTGADSAKFIITSNFEGYQGITKKYTTVSATAFSPATGSSVTATTVPATTSGVGSITYKIPNTVTLGQNGILTFTFTIYDGADATSTSLGQVTKIYNWTRSNAVDAPIFLLLETPDGTVFEKNGTTASPSSVRAVLSLIEGSSIISSNVTYKWYTGTNYATEITSTSSSANLYKDGNTLYIKPAAIDGYASFKGTATYNNNTYTQYVSITDKSDPLQISVHSTVGLQIKNSQGVGAIYARVTQDGEEIDEVPEDIEAGIVYPTSGIVNGSMFVKLSTEEHKYERTATLMKYNGSTWVAATAAVCSYEWTFRDEDNNVITDTTKLPYQYSSPNLNKNQFIYIDADLINSKITADVRVTKN